MLPWACVWMVCSPDLISDGLKGSRTGRQRAVGLGPQPRPVGIPEVDEFCFALGEGGSGLPECISCTPEWIISESHDMIMASVVNLPSKEVLPQANNFF